MLQNALKNIPRHKGGGIRPRFAWKEGRKGDRMDQSRPRFT